MQLIRHKKNVKHFIRVDVGVFSKTGNTIKHVLKKQKYSFQINRQTGGYIFF